MKRIYRIAAMILVTLLLAELSACGTKKETAAAPELTAVMDGHLSTLDPIYAESTADQTVLAHIYENLMRVATDEKGNPEVTEGIARSVEQEQNADGSVTYTFKLRNARWSDGRTIKAQDFVYAWQRLANPAMHSPFAELLSIVCGYKEARAENDMSLLEINAKNDNTLVVRLNGNYDWFITEVCTATATMPLRQDVLEKLKEAGLDEDGRQVTPWWSDFSKLVTNGPFRTGVYERGEKLHLGAFARYYAAEELEYTNIELVFADSAIEAEALYREGKADVLCTVSYQEDALENGEVQPSGEAVKTERPEEKDLHAAPELACGTLLLNGESEALEDPVLRQAMVMVLDRERLAAAAGGTAHAAQGLVPCGVPENEEKDFRSAGGDLMEERPEDPAAEAKELLEEAGYDPARSLGGDWEFLYEDTGNNSLVALELCGQWKSALGMSVTPVGISRTELWSALRKGEYVLAAAELTPIANDAECFLMDWTSESRNNVVGHRNFAYDTLLAIIGRAADGTARMGCLHDAEELLLEDATVIPLLHTMAEWRCREDLTGVFRDPRGWFGLAGAKMVQEKTA